MKDEGDDLLLEDPEFLEQVANGLESVKIRPKGDTASAIAAANAGTRAFRDRAIRLRAIARRVREAKLPLSEALMQEAWERFRARATQWNPAVAPVEYIRTDLGL